MEEFIQKEIEQEWKPLPLDIIVPQNYFGKAFSNDYFKPNRSGHTQIVSSTVFFRTKKRLGQCWYFGQYNFDSNEWSVHDAKGSKLKFYDAFIDCWFYPPDEIYVKDN